MLSYLSKMRFVSSVYQLNAIVLRKYVCLGIANKKIKVNSRDPHALAVDY